MMHVKIWHYQRYAFSCNINVCSIMSGFQINAMPSSTVQHILKNVIKQNTRGMKGEVCKCVTLFYMLCPVLKYLGFTSYQNYLCFAAKHLKYVLKHCRLITFNLQPLTLTESGNMQWMHWMKVLICVCLFVCLF